MPSLDTQSRWADFERTGLRFVFDKLAGFNLFRRHQAPHLKVVYRPPGYAISAVTADAADTPVDPADAAAGWNQITFEMRWLVIGRDRYAAVLCKGLVIVDPFLWRGWDDLPDSYEA